MSIIWAIIPKLGDFPVWISSCRVEIRIQRQNLNGILVNNATRDFCRIFFLFARINRLLDLRASILVGMVRILWLWWDYYTIFLALGFSGVRPLPLRRTTHLWLLTVTSLSILWLRSSPSSIGIPLCYRIFILFSQ